MCFFSFLTILFYFVSDTIQLIGNDKKEVILIKRNISWPSDKTNKFKNPGSLDPSSDKFGEFIKKYFNIFLFVQ